MPGSAKCVGLRQRCFRKDLVRLYSEKGCSDVWDSMLGERRFYIAPGQTVTVSMPRRATATVGDVRTFEEWFYEDMFWGGNAFDFPWDWHYG